jgi:hypothetical protein
VPAGLIFVLAVALLIAMAHHRSKAHHHKQHAHPRRLFVLFFRNQSCRIELHVLIAPFLFRKGVMSMPTTPIQPPPNAVTTLFSNDSLGVSVVIVEADDNGKIFPFKGPLSFAVDDPGSTVTVTPGAADGSTPERLVPNGSGNTGAVTVTVTDSGNNLVGSATLTIVPPVTPPPTVPTQLGVFFVPNTTAPAPAAATLAAAAPVATTAAPTAAKTDPHGNPL